MAMMRQSDDAMAMALFAQEWDSVTVVSSAFYFNLLIPFMFDGKILK